MIEIEGVPESLRVVRFGSPKPDTLERVWTGRVLLPHPLQQGALSLIVIPAPGYVYVKPNSLEAEIAVTRFFPPIKMCLTFEISNSAELEALRAFAANGSHLHNIDLTKLARGLREEHHGG